MGIFDSLIVQAKHPKGFVGKTMLKIMNAAHHNMMLWGLSKVNIDEYSVVLDIGCGGGETIKILSDIALQGKIYGIDCSEDAVSVSIRINCDDVKKGKVTIKQASVSSIPFPDNYFDVITAFQTHYFWPDLKLAMIEIKRVLKPKGQFVLTSEIYKINYHMTEYKTADTLKKLLLETDFSQVDTYVTKKNMCVVNFK